jgi:hypothetical protein
VTAGTKVLTPTKDTACLPELLRSNLRLSGGEGGNLQAVRGILPPLCDRHKVPRFEHYNPISGTPCDEVSGGSYSRGTSPGLLHQGY